MLAILLYSAIAAPTITAGLYTLLSGPGPAGRTPKHRKGQ
jgi:hypothetical protein